MDYKIKCACEEISLCETGETIMATVFNRTENLKKWYTDHHS